MHGTAPNITTAPGEQPARVRRLAGRLVEASLKECFLACDLTAERPHDLDAAIGIAVRKCRASADFYREVARHHARAARRIEVLAEARRLQQAAIEFEQVLNEPAAVQS